MMGDLEVSTNIFLCTQYGLVGSTEWVEEYLPWISAANVAYINVDVGVRSPTFSASAAPLLHNLLYEVTALVPSPNQTVQGQTVRDLWDGHISTMGSGSDFTAFQDYAGVPSLDMGFGGPDSEAPIYQYVFSKLLICRFSNTLTSIYYSPYVSHPTFFTLRNDF